MLGTYYKSGHTLYEFAKYQTSTLISRLKMCDNLPYPRVATVEPPWMATIHFKTWMFKQMQVPVAARSKSWICGRSLAGTAGSNPTGGMDV